MSRFACACGLAVVLLGAIAEAESAAAEKSIRKQAVIDYTFDEPSGDAIDHATAGTGKDAGKFINGPRRVASPFWNQHRGKALQFNAARKQYVQVADGADTDRPNGVSVSFFYLNLHPANDGVTHGIFAKRTDAGKRNTNYGVNYIMSADSIRPYINDGSGFRYPDFSAKQVLGTRRLVYLTVTYEIGDAPAPDADTDKDDVLMRFYVNGQQVQPKGAVRVNLVGKDAWATDVNVKQLLNDIPLTLGSTNAATEHASGLLDEFTLFDRALAPSEVAALFREVAGPDAAQLAADELQPPKNPAPQIAALSLNGLQIGQTTRLVITGQNLGDHPAVRLPFPGVKQTVQQGSNAGQLVVDVTIPKSFPATLTPLRVQTDNGLSKPIVIAIDHLPQHSATGSSADKPVTLPAAFSGTISGTQRAQIFFRGKAGQRIVADVEAKRLGAGMDPVIEIKSARGTPLVIAWSKVYLKGDARAETTLPADGVYYVEFHDLEFRAPGRNPFRLKIGDLKIVDAWFPTAVSAGGSTSVTPIGTGFKSGESYTLSLTNTNASQVAATGSEFTPAVQPWHAISDVREFVEPVTPPKQPPSVNAVFVAGEPQAVAINGRLLKPEETDRFVLHVKPGQRLDFSLLGRAIDSPIDAEVTVTALPQKTVIARGEDRPGSRDPKFALTVPGGVTQVEVAVRDLYGRGGSHFQYRLLVSAVGLPDFRLATTSASLSLPANGSGFLPLQVTRNGYNGPIALRVPGDDSLSFSPATIAAGRTGRVFVRVTQRSDAKTADFRHVRLVGESTGVKPILRQPVNISDATQTIAGWETELPLIAGKSAPFDVKLAMLPPALFKGARGRAAIEVTRDAKLKGLAVRLTLVSSEPTRPVDPKDPKKGNKPRVRSVPGQSISANAIKGPLVIAVPLDVTASQIEFVLRADLMPHPYSSRIIATTFSEPFQLSVQTAVAVRVDDKSLVVRESGTITGTIQRTAGFNSPLTVQLAGLPKGYAAQAVIVPAGKSTFTIPVGPARKEDLKTLPKGIVPPPSTGKVTLTVADRFNSALLPPQTIAIKFLPPHKPAVAPKPKKPAAKTK